jgi:hypothetical protein
MGGIDTRREVSRMLYCAHEVDTAGAGKGMMGGERWWETGEGEEEGARMVRDMMLEVEVVLARC